MTTPEQIIAKIEEIEKLTAQIDLLLLPEHERIDSYYLQLMGSLLSFKQSVIDYYNLPTADPPEGSPGQSDMEG